MLSKKKYCRFKEGDKVIVYDWRKLVTGEVTSTSLFRACGHYREDTCRINIKLERNHVANKNVGSLGWSFKDCINSKDHDVIPFKEEWWTELSSMLTTAHGMIGIARLEQFNAIEYRMTEIYNNVFKKSK